MSTPNPLGENGPGHAGGGMSGGGTSGGPPGGSTLTGSRTAENLTARAHEGIDQLAAGASAAERRVRDTAAKMSGQLGTAAERARERSMQMKQQVSEYAGSNPMTSLALAFVAGVLLTVLMRR